MKFRHVFYPKTSVVLSVFSLKTPNLFSLVGVGNISLDPLKSIFWRVKSQFANAVGIPNFCCFFVFVSFASNYK